MKELNTLQTLGFNEYEQNVYTFLLERGVSSPTDIEKKLNMHRPIVYRTLEDLLKKGVIRISPHGKRTLYAPESPEKLEQLFKKLEHSFFSHIEDLHHLYEKGQKNKPVVTYAEGKQALIDAYIDIPQTLEKGGMYYRYISTSTQNRDKFAIPLYSKLRDQKDLQRLIITNIDEKRLKPKLGVDIRALPKEFDLFQYNIGQVIYKNKVAIFDYENESVTTIVNEKYARFQERLFKLLFSLLKK